MNEALKNLNQEAQVALDGSGPVARDAAGFINIKFQCGPIKEVGVNGTSIENVAQLLIDRLEGFQKGPFKCESNQKAITALKMAIEALEERTRKRQAQGVEGTNQAHSEESTDTNVTISKEEYENLCEDQRMLNALQAAGVDNWDWYDDAMEMFHKGE